MTTVYSGKFRRCTFFAIWLEIPQKKCSWIRFSMPGNQKLCMWNTGAWDFITVLIFLLTATKFCTSQKFPAIRYDVALLHNQYSTLKKALKPTRLSFPVLSISSPSMELSFMCTVTENTEWERDEQALSRVAAVCLRAVPRSRME